MGRASRAFVIHRRFALAVALLFAGAGAGRSNPTGGEVVSGAATITTVPGTVTINQASNTAAINWRDFSIASGELTRFQVPSSTSATLNRVTGGNVSAIYGTLQSNGQLYLINPNGIVVGASGKIDTAGFLATTLNFSDKEFEKMGDLKLSGKSTAGISNQGTIHASTGDVYLIAAHVDNHGVITAPKGTVGLAAGNSVLLQKAGDRHLFVQVEDATQAAGANTTGVTNSGSIRAAAAELTAAGGNAYALAINNSGNIKATGIATINGQVYLTTDGADITNSGTISAKQANGNGGTVVVNAHASRAATKGTVINSGKIVAAGTKGGTVELLGDRVGVTDAGSVDVSGAAGGGTVLIGGDDHGANPAVADADQTYIGPDATIDADALTLGSGGKVIVWGNDTTQVYGAISARGGAMGGDGGYVETSGHDLQVLTAPDLSAPMGKDGMWLLDPSTVTISDTVTDSGFTSPPAFTITNTGSFTPPVTISQATLQSALETGDVTIDASQGTGGAGTITWNQTLTPLTVTNPGGHTLTLDAPVALTLDDVTVNSSGTGGLNMVFNSSLTGAGSVNLQNSTINLNGGSFTAKGNGYQSMTDQIGVANGVNLFNSSINAEGGNINLTGNAGFANPGTGVSAGQGVGIFTGGTPMVALSTTGAGNITITGTFSQNISTSTPIVGVLVDNDVGIQVQAGTIGITGTLSSGFGSTYQNISIGTGASVKSTTNTGVVILNGEDEIDVSGTLSGAGVAIDSYIINLSGASLTATGTQFNGSEQGLGLSNDSGGGGAINIANSTLTGSDIVIGYDPASGLGGNLNVGTGVVNIDNSSIQLVQGSNPAFELSLNIHGESLSPGEPGVMISNASLITANNGGQVSISGVGFNGNQVFQSIVTAQAKNALVGNASPSVVGSIEDTIGVAIMNSTISAGTASATNGSLSIMGTSDDGTTYDSTSSFEYQSFGVQVSGSTITSHLSSGMTLQGTAYAADNMVSAGVDLSANTSIQQVGNGELNIKGTVLTEAFGDGTSGAANVVAGVQAVSTQITATGATATISIDGDTSQATATDGGDVTVQAQNVGTYLQANTTISASGSSTLLSTPIFIAGNSGGVVALDGNTQQTDSFGLSIGGGSTTGPVTITNSGLGATLLAGEAGEASGGGSSLFSVGVLIGGSNTTTANITAPGGGSIGIAGLGGEIAPDGTTPGQAVGVWSLFSNVTTTTGDIAILAAAGSAAGTAVPTDLVGLDLGSSIIQTSTSTAGANQLPGGGGSVPPLILIYATGGTATLNGSIQFQGGSSNSYAVREDPNSKLVTGDLVMGNYFDLFSAYAPSSVAAPDFSSFLSTNGVSFNPAGLIDLSSPLNQVTNLTGALDGSGGINFFDSTSLTVGTIGASDNTNNGEIDEPGLGPVAITVAPNQSLTLTNVSKFTGAASGLPVISTAPGNGITLTTSGAGTFTNLGGASALAAGSEFVVYVNDPTQANLGGIVPELTLFTTPPGTVASPVSDTLAFASPQPTGGGTGPSTGGGVPPAQPPGSGGSLGTSNDLTDAVADADNNGDSSSQTSLNSILYEEGDSLTGDVGIVPGGTGVSTDEDDHHKHRKHDKSKEELLSEIQLQDARDGSPVNTGTTEPKLSANTGFSRIVHISEYALLPSGSVQLQVSDPAVAHLFDEQASGSVRSELGQAAGAKGP